MEISLIPDINNCMALTFLVHNDLFYPNEGTVIRTSGGMVGGGRQ